MRRVPVMTAGIWLILALAIIAAGSPARAHEFKVGSIVVERPWARATPARVGGAYLTIRNRGNAPDRLIGVSSPAAEKAEIHETKTRGGTASMHAVGTLEIKPRATVQLKPGGIHLMLMGLQRPLKEGERLKLVLTFEKAGAIEVEATVEKAGAPGPTH
jgi:copper(I)-binding protein